MDLRLAVFGLLVACGGGGKAEVCGNERDDNGDGLVDCADPDCADPACAEICEDGVDNNLDDVLDCADPNCVGACPEVCDDNADNDNDGKADCEDADCGPTCDFDGDASWSIAVGGDDCDDTNPEVYPGADEVCDGVDNDCNELVDRDDPDLDPTSLTEWFRDIDGDGFGLTNISAFGCEQPPNSADQGGDCNDSDPLRNPNAQEICNMADDDCDGDVDDQDPTIDLSGGATYWVDADDDGLGDPFQAVVLCRMYAGHADNDDDCDDSNADVLGESNWLLDTDGDGFGSGTPVGPFGCTAPGANYVPDYTEVDCDETNVDINPGAYEVCGDLIDATCNGTDCDDWTDDFEAGVLGPEWVTTGAQPWFVQGAPIYAGAFAAESGNIGDNQVSIMAVTLDFQTAGSIELWHSGDTEGFWDYLRIVVDGVELGAWSGNWPWTFATYPIAAGTHTIEIQYTKDGSVSTGADTVWIDDFAAIGGVY